MQSKSRYLTFLYHEAVDNPNDSGFQRKGALPYKHGEKEFLNNIDIIVASEKKIITLKQLDSYNEAIMISFDDGGKSSMFIADYLEKHNICGHFFITTSLIGNKYFLNKEQIIDLHNRGHIIGSHSHTHPNVFKSLSYKEMLEEWIASKNILEDILDVEVTSCSVPGGDVNRDTYNSATECGYKYIFDSEPKVHLRKNGDSIIIGRICPNAGTNLEVIKNLANFKGITKQLFVRRFKTLIKTILFPIYSKVHNSHKHEQ